MRLVDEGGTDVLDDDAGEIGVRGANLFSGYWPDGSGGPDADGWWATGDVAYADEDGDLFLVDRRKELVSSAASTSTRARWRTRWPSTRTSPRSR